MNNQQKLELAKRKVDSMIGLPNVMLRKGVARNGDALTGFTDYNYKLLRDEDRHWLFYCEWVDLEGEGFRIVLPHPNNGKLLPRCPRCGRSLIDDYGDLYCLVCGSNPRPAPVKLPVVKKVNVRSVK